jgi:hypothetical protein
MGDVAQNVKAAMNISSSLVENGLAPFCPHLYHFMDMNSPQPYETWLAVDIAFLRVCDAVLRIPGASNGADKEVACAEASGIPVYYSLEELLKNFK